MVFQSVQPIVGQESTEQVSSDPMVRYLEVHPEYYAIMKSSLFIRVLESISHKAKNIMMTKQSFPSIEAQDMLEILVMLEEIGVVSHLDASSVRFYYTNNKGKEFLAMYARSKQQFTGQS